MDSDRIDLMLRKLDKPQILRMKRFFNQNYYKHFAEHRNAMKMRLLLDEFTKEREIEFKEFQYRTVITAGRDDPIFEELIEDNYSEATFELVADNIMRNANDA